MTSGLDGSAYSYDAQNRVISASKNGTTSTFKYDALNRQVTRYVNGVRSDTIYDGWNAIIQLGATNNWTNASWYGPDGVFAEMNGVTWSAYSCYHDASGSTTALADGTGLLEWYRYDLDGTPMIYAPDGSSRTASAYDIRHYFTGQQWYSELGLYDLRNRFYSPDIGRFLQTDPIDFNGDATNLYRYCGNNPLKASDPFGLWTFQIGISATVQFGSVVFGGSFGLAFDGHGNVGVYGTTLVPAVGAGAAAGLGFSGAGSNADTIYGLRGPFAQTGVQAGKGVMVGADSFTGVDSNTGRVVSGVGITIGSGEGVGAYSGVTQTSIGTLVSSSSSNPPPGGTTYVDPNICPQCAEVPRVTVSAPPIYERSQSSSGPTWGNGVGIFDTTGFNAVYTSNFYDYTGSLPTTLSNPFGSAGLSSGGPIGNYPLPNGETGSTSMFGPGNWYAGLDPVPGSVTIGMGVGAMEPGLGCFAAGTPVLMADGSEKPIENIQPGEAVLAWNDETRQNFSTKVVRALHHDEKMQILFEIELEDGHSFTVNNNHPMYVIEDDEFILTRELATRFAKGEPITFQGSNGRPIKVATMRMRREICKVYNLQVEGQGKNGHTYYASGVLVHNIGRTARK